LFCSHIYAPHPLPHSFPTRRSSDLAIRPVGFFDPADRKPIQRFFLFCPASRRRPQNIAARRRPELTAGIYKCNRWRKHWTDGWRSEEHTSELQSRGHLVCRLLLEKK